MGPFEQHTAVRPRSPGAYEASIDSSWMAGPVANGGYLCAIAFRAMEDALDDPTRFPRSFSAQFVAPARPGPALVRVHIERVGRSLASVSARLEQEERVLLVATATFAAPLNGVEFDELRPPSTPAATAVAPGWPLDAPPPEFIGHFDHRPVLGPPPFSGADDALSGGWTRLVEPRPTDAAAVLAMVDAWPQALFARVTDEPRSASIDLTVFFRGDLPRAGVGSDDHVLCVFRSRLATGGFCEEDGEVWSADGTLLAQSRQLLLAATIG